MGLSIAKPLDTTSHRITPRLSWRIVLPVGCALSVTLSAVLAGAAMDGIAPDLGRMLRSMAALKAVMAMAAFGVAWWRLAYPVSQRIALAYSAGIWLMASASVLLWQLAHMMLAGTLFHVGMALMLLAAWRDMPRVKAQVR